MNVINNLGAITIFFTLAFLKIFRRKQLREIIQQVFYIGAKSSNIVMLVGLFTGMVLGLQLFYTLNKFGSRGGPRFSRCPHTHQGTGACPYCNNDNRACRLCNDRRDR